MASEAQRQCFLNQVIFIPCWQSPHKPDADSTDVGHRLEMTRLATKGLPWAKVSDYETERREVSYSWQTTQHFKNQHPKAQLYWLLGADQWKVIDTWSLTDFLVEHLTFLVCPRGDQPIQSHSGLNSMILEGRFDAVGTDIRAEFKKNTHSAELSKSLSPEVLTYINKQRLYRS